MKTPILSLVSAVCFLAVLVAPQTALAQGCDVRSAGVSGISLGDFNPLSNRALTRDLSFPLTGPAGSQAWVRVQTEPRPQTTDRLDIEFLGLANAGLTRIDGSAAQALASDVGTLNASWLPVFFDAQGQGLARVIANIPETAYALAGSQTTIVNLAVACPQDGLVNVDNFPMTVASLNVRVLSAIRVTDPTNNVLRFGTIPENNPEGYSPASAHATLSVASTGGFDVQLASSDWVMRGVSESGANFGRDTIPFRAVLTTGSGVQLDGSNKSLICDASPSAQSVQSLELRALLPGNAAQGKMAGLYRGHLTVVISPLELVARDQTQGCRLL